MADKAHDATDEILAGMESRLSAIYDQAHKEIEAKAAAYFEQFEKLDAQKRKLVDAGKLSEEEYKKWRRNKIMYGKHWTNLKAQLAEEYANVNCTALAYINGKLPEVYALNYNDIGAELDDKVKGYSFELVDAQTVKNLATKDETLLPYKYLNGVKDVRWNTQKVNAAVLQGILQGESIPDLAKRLQSVTNMNKVSAIRNARTTVTSAECKGRQNSYEKATQDGIELKREWIAAIDGRTRHAHRLLDGQLADVDNPFKSELGDIMYPGDPEADPSNVYNCRCTIAAKVIGFKKVQVEKVMEEQYDDAQRKETLHFIEESSRFKDYEVGTILDRNGNIISSIGGSASQVEISDDLIPQMKENIFTHNHPNGGCFSRNDILNFVKTDLFEVRASTPQGTVFSLQKGNGQIFGDDMLHTFKAEKVGDRKKVQQILQEKLDNGEVSSEEWAKKGYGLIVRLQEQDIENWLTKNATKFGYVFTKGEI